VDPASKRPEIFDSRRDVNDLIFDNEGADRPDALGKPSLGGQELRRMMI
jgi:hypothetical protein